MWKNGTDLETIRILLGQSSIESTKNYLGVDREDALEVNSKFVI
jgi:site-specific recombinase XerD